MICRPPRFQVLRILLTFSLNMHQENAPANNTTYEDTGLTYNAMNMETTVAAISMEEEEEEKDNEKEASESGYGDGKLFQIL
jgi:hypothetical protein